MPEVRSRRPEHVVIFVLTFGHTPSPPSHSGFRGSSPTRKGWALVSCQKVALNKRVGQLSPVPVRVFGHLSSPSATLHRHPAKGGRWCHVRKALNKGHLSSCSLSSSWLYRVGPFCYEAQSRRMGPYMRLQKPILILAHLEPIKPIWVLAEVL